MTEPKLVSMLLNITKYIYILVYTNAFIRVIQAYYAMFATCQVAYISSKNQEGIHFLYYFENKKTLGCMFSIFAILHGDCISEKSCQPWQH